MPRTKQKKTANQIAWEKEVARIRRRERELTKRGYSFVDYNGEYTGSLPTRRPQRVTQKELERLRAIKGAAFYKVGSFVDPQSGELLTAAEGRALEASRRARKGWQTRRRPQIAEPQPEEPEFEDIPGRLWSTDNIVKFFKDLSELKEFGGWIEDKVEYSRRYGGQYAQAVKNFISAELTPLWETMEPFQRVVVQGELERELEAIAYAYENFTSSVEAFKAARDRFYLMKAAFSRANAMVRTNYIR